MSMTYSDVVYSTASEKILDRITDEDGDFDLELFKHDMELELLAEIDRLHAKLSSMIEKESSTTKK